MDFEKDRIAQLQLPDPADADPHPRLLLEGRGIHAGELSLIHISEPTRH